MMNSCMMLYSAGVNDAALAKPPFPQPQVFKPPALHLLSPPKEHFMVAYLSGLVYKR
jgi:hypothetical protein